MYKTSPRLQDVCYVQGNLNNKVTGGKLSPTSKSRLKCTFSRKINKEKKRTHHNHNPRMRMRDGQPKPRAAQPRRLLVTLKSDEERGKSCRLAAVSRGAQRFPGGAVQLGVVPDA